jgi:hypothetical protein
MPSKELPLDTAAGLANGARILLQTPIACGVDTIFGYPGGAVLPLDNATAEHTAQRFRFVLNRLDAAMRLSMAYDSRRDVAQHRALWQSTEF